MDTQLDATLRETSRGKLGARKVRKSGQLPGVIYGTDAQATHITVNPDALNTIFRKTQDRNTVVHLKLEGKSLPCLVRAVQRNPLSRAYVHVDFMRLEANQQIIVQVPVEAIGKAAGLALGGTLVTLSRTVPVRCNWDNIPHVITGEVSALEINQFLNISQMVAPPGATLVYDNDFHVFTVVGKRAEEELEAKPAEGEAAEGEAAEGAEGEKKEGEEDESDE